MDHESPLVIGSHFHCSICTHTRTGHYVFSQSDYTDGSVANGIVLECVCLAVLVRETERSQEGLSESMLYCEIRS